MIDLKYIPVRILNEDENDRWNLCICRLDDGRYQVADNAKYSLFPSSVFPIGNTPGEALDLFLAKEQEILDGL